MFKSNFNPLSNQRCADSADLSVYRGLHVVAQNNQINTHTAPPARTIARPPRASEIQEKLDGVAPGHTLRITPLDWGRFALCRDCGMKSFLECFFS